MIYPTPLAVPEVEVDSPIINKAGLRLIIRREDLNHAEISGNKYWKLKYNVLEAQRLGQDTVLTFGGAFSNHIAATSAACRSVGIKSIGIIRGEDADLKNPTLAKAAGNGMKLHLVSREQYREKGTEPFVKEMRKLFGRFYPIPEGGTNELAIKGTGEMTHSIKTPFDFLALPVGTGGTIVGCINELQGRAHVLGFSALKGNFLTAEIEELQRLYGLSRFTNWEVVGNYHFGGYGKVNNDLLHFMQDFEQQQGIPLDPIYTGKMMFGIVDMIQKGTFPKGSTVLAVHTGGLQGMAGIQKKLP